jgi:RimJ/RimL family protein N-acetyltransferase
MSGILQTERLILRRLVPDDEETLRRLADDRAIADTMISVPYPFTIAHARAWISAYGETGPAAPHRYFAACLRDGGTLAGLTALRDIDADHQQAELSFWVGRPYWGRGLATEAGAAVVRFGFEVLQLNRITAYHMVRNPASGRVLERLGFRLEGLLRQRVRKWGVFEDVHAYAILKAEAPAAHDATESP